jgi:hypothetical protein
MTARTAFCGFLRAADALLSACCVSIDEETLMTKGAKEAKRPQAAFITDEAQRLLERRRREVAAHRPRLDSESTICQYEPRREAHCFWQRRRR